ncbi:MAG: sigma-70 family RNA polymerase sigma factor [Chloroflexota bacterium]
MEQDPVVRAMAGEHEAYAELVRARLPQLYVTARMILRDSELAEDAVQEALIVAWRDLSALRDPSRFDAWLRSLLVRACYREAGRARRRRRVTELLRHSDEAIPDAGDEVADRDEVERAFLALAPEQRALLVLHFYQGLPLSETAEALGLPVGTVKTRLYRTTAQMRALLDAAARLPLTRREAY